MINIEAKDFPIKGLEATGEVVKVHVPKGAKMRSYNLFGNQGGSITVDGDGDGDVCRYGDGDGSAYRAGGGNGHAYRNGEIEEDE